MMEIVLVLLVVFGVGISVGFFVICNFYYICQLSEVLIFVGSCYSVGDSQKKVGYCLVKGGSSVCVFLLE